MLLFDPQTSGGLMIGIGPNELAGFLETAKGTNQPVWVVGEVIEGSGIQVIR
jgi:selenide,water dikinase